MIGGVTFLLGTPEVDGLSAVAHVLRAWQDDGAPERPHPGDLGWFWRFGAEATARAVRTWSRGGRVLAMGLLDGPDLVRLAIAPHVERDEELARRLAEDVTDPACGVLGEGEAYVEAPPGALVRDRLAERGWVPGEAWTPLRRDLADPVPAPGPRIEVTTPDRAWVRAAVQRASFDGSTFTEDRWRAMAAGAPYADARCLVAHDRQGRAVAAATVWSAGPGRPGLLEPMGVHRDHRGQGHGRAIVVAAAAALRELGSSSAVVRTPSANLAAVATYASAGFQRSPETRDLRRAP
ncbi:Acetyltransferase (GNAT) family protein [Actinoalloteichus cyanogriseus DSM 43889]|uniref:Acetyltransferase (GNAT) family protein n=1 Tax=Actinoalloteichus caeruleus DSM 43889 TaxID=1120930 RepID=A0ABT1JEC2_ACTCY|nr:Acetyltransferase (GNAT) family protein [Actinoalloteichus caeruleus DSM 43889]